MDLLVACFSLVFVSLLEAAIIGVFIFWINDLIKQLRSRSVSEYTSAKVIEKTKGQAALIEAVDQVAQRANMQAVAPKGKPAKLDNYDGMWSG